MLMSYRLILKQNEEQIIQLNVLNPHFILLFNCTILNLLNWKICIDMFGIQVKGFPYHK